MLHEFIIFFLQSTQQFFNVKRVQNAQKLIIDYTLCAIWFRVV